MVRKPATERASRWRRWLLEIVILLLVLFGVHLYQTRTTAQGAAPPILGVDLYGAPVALDALRGRPVLVHFWATWCPVCALEQNSIDSIARDWPVVTLALEDSSIEELRGFMNREGLSFPVLRDADGELAGRYGVRGVPTSFVLDGAGRIRFTSVGYTTEAGLRLRLWLAATFAGTQQAEAP